MWSLEYDSVSDDKNVVSKHFFLIIQLQFNLIDRASFLFLMSCPVAKRRNTNELKQKKSFIQLQYNFFIH